MNNYCQCSPSDKKVLLVEGVNDCHVIIHLCMTHNLPEKSFCIHDCKSESKLLKKIESYLNRSERPEMIGIVLDADQENPNIRLQQVASRLLKYSPQYQIPEQLNPNGTIIPAVIDDDEKYPKIGIWVMPNNQEIGMLEDFVIELAKGKHSASLDYAEHCVIHAKNNEFTTFKQNHHSKAVIHTYLAWHDEPGKPLGQSITAHTLEPYTPIAKTFTDWLVNLFDLDNLKTALKI